VAAAVRRDERRPGTRGMISQEHVRAGSSHGKPDFIPVVPFQGGSGDLRLEKRAGPKTPEHLPELGLLQIELLGVGQDLVGSAGRKVAAAGGDPPRRGGKDGRGPGLDEGGAFLEDLDFDGLPRQSLVGEIHPAFMPGQAPAGIDDFLYRQPDSRSLLEGHGRAGRRPPRKAEGNPWPGRRRMSGTPAPRNGERCRRTYKRRIRS